MNFEKLQESMVLKIFHSGDDFKRSVNDALKAFKEGHGFEPNSIGFANSLLGSVKLNSNEMSIFRREVKEMINSLDEEKEDNGELFTEEERKQIINDSEKKEWRESKRSGGVDID